MLYDLVYICDYLDIAYTLPKFECNSEYAAPILNYRRNIHPSMGWNHRNLLNILYLYFEKYYE
jgi:hypothetical protein